MYLPPDTGERVPPYPQPDWLVLDLPTPEGWKAELTSCRRVFLVFFPWQDSEEIRGISRLHRFFSRDNRSSFVVSCSLL